MAESGWIGVDFDGTLAVYDGWKGIGVFGDPIQPMVKRVKDWLANGVVVKIFTARWHNGPEEIEAIRKWCELHIGEALPVTATKDYAMIELWDDRCVQVEMNKGTVLGLYGMGDKNA